MMMKRNLELFSYDFGTILSIDFVLCISNVYMAKDKKKTNKYII